MHSVEEEDGPITIESLSKEWRPQDWDGDRYSDYCLWARDNSYIHLAFSDNNVFVWTGDENGDCGDKWPGCKTRKQLESLIFMLRGD